jgi:hypothetical protein
MKRVRLGMTLGTAGGGTVDATVPVWGDVAEVRYNGGTAFIGSGTVVITRAEDGGTVFSGTPGSVTWSYVPMQSRHTLALGSVGTDAPVPVDGYLRMVVTGGGSAAAGTVEVYVR